MIFLSQRELRELDIISAQFSGIITQLKSFNALYALQNPLPSSVCQLEHQEILKPEIPVLSSDATSKDGEFPVLVTFDKSPLQQTIIETTSLSDPSIYLDSKISPEEYAQTAEPISTSVLSSETPVFFPPIPQHFLNSNFICQSFRPFGFLSKDKPSQAPSRSGISFFKTTTYPLILSAIINSTSQLSNFLFHDEVIFKDNPNYGRCLLQRRYSINVRAFIATGRLFPAFYCSYDPHGSRQYFSVNVPCQQVAVQQIHLVLRAFSSVFGLPITDNNVFSTIFHRQ